MIRGAFLAFVYLKLPGILQQAVESENLPSIPITTGTFMQTVDLEVGMERRAEERFWIDVLIGYKNEWRPPAPVPCLGRSRYDTHKQQRK